MTDLSVQPVRTFWHGELKTKRSKAFDVETGVAHELKTLGLVEIKSDAVKAEPEEVETETPVVDLVVEQPVVEPAVPTTTKKKGKPNADDKDS